MATATRNSSTPDNAEVIERACAEWKRWGLAETTINKRRWFIEWFAIFLEEQGIGHLFDAVKDDVDDYRATRGQSASTQASLIQHLHMLYRWAIDNRLTEDDPTVKIRRPKQKKRVPRPADDDQLSEALATATPKARAWICLAAYQGLRCKEIAGLDWQDVMEGRGLLRAVQTKGVVEREIPLHPETLAALKAYLSAREVPDRVRAQGPIAIKNWERGGRRGVIFLRPEGGRYPPEQLSKEFGRILCDLDVEATPHQLRHWFGTKFYQATKDILATQKMLGHSSPTTTAIYAQYDETKAREGIESLSMAS